MSPEPESNRNSIHSIITRDDILYKMLLVFTYQESLGGDVSIKYTCKPNFCNEKVWLIEKFG